MQSLVAPAHQGRGTVTETQEHSITWHYREADEDFGEIQASDLQMHLERGGNR